MIILGIETSCDETAVAVVEDGTRVLCNTITSTQDVFKDTGGVVPEDAARRQVECMMPVLKKALEDANVSKDEVDAIAVTRGPGLVGSLLVGTVTARTLASLWRKPLIGVHHTFGHLSSTWLDADPTPEFPSITLSASGGHTDLWYRTSHTKGTLLGRTRDDAAGEAFDKGASMLGLPYPGGPSISKSAEQGSERAIDFPIALKGDSTLDFSFSGLKTALKNSLGDASTEDLAASFQYAICKQLVDRIQMAVQEYPDVTEIHIVGGCSANTRLREMIQSELLDHTLKVPMQIRFCTDNAAMIAAGGYFLVQEKDDPYKPFETSATVSIDSCVA